MAGGVGCWPRNAVDEVTSEEPGSKAWIGTVVKAWNGQHCQSACRGHVEAHLCLHVPSYRIGLAWIQVERKLIICDTERFRVATRS